MIPAGGPDLAADTTVRRGTARKEVAPRRTECCGLQDGHPAAVCSVQVLPFQTSASGDTVPFALGLLAPTAEQ